MKIKTADLIGDPLDWAVATCETVAPVGSFLDNLTVHPVFLQNFKPSTDWSQGGPIIERERIHICPVYFNGKAATEAWLGEGLGRHQTYRGPTPLIAIMRCFVASKLGDEVDVPEELTKE